MQIKKSWLVRMNIDDKTTETTGGGDDPRDWRFPDAPTDTSDQRKWWDRGGARPKDSGYQPIPLSERSGLPKTLNRGESTAETSFI